MKSFAFVYTTALLLGSWATAQMDPFQRGLPSVGQPLQVEQKLNTFGQPRTSDDGAATRVVFDLPVGMQYSLTPTFSGLRIDVEGATVTAGNGRLGNSVTDYRAYGNHITLTTPFPLALKDGWRATEATIANGNRVLILEFGATLSGGVSPSVRGKLLTTPPVYTPQATQQPLSPEVAQMVPPSDTVQITEPTEPTLPLAGVNVARSTQLTGQVQGVAMGLPLGVPRIGKNPGLTRVVLDLPEGTSYHLTASPKGLRVDLTGVTAVPLSSDKITPELKSWRIDPLTSGVSATFITAKPLSARGGWRAQLLPPAEGSNRSRLAIDFSPAIADLSPLTPREKVIAAVPPFPSNTRTAVLALTSSYVKPRVVIDPGHGGVDPGAVGSVMEKQVVLAVSLRVRELLQAAGVDVIMTRDRDMHLSPDKSTDLNRRAALANNNQAQIYVSIHANAMPAKGILRGYGIETWWNPNHPLSATLAGILQRNTVEYTSAHNMGLKTGRSLAVLRNSRMPAALIEIGYITHPVDIGNLQDENYLERVSVGIAAGIREALISGVTASGTVSGAVGGGDR